MEAIAWVIALLIGAIVLAPFAGSLVRRVRHSRHRKIVDSPRKIRIAASDAAAGAAGCGTGEHVRNSARVRHDGKGGYVSVCSRCGIRLARTRHGEWHPLEADKESADATKDNGKPA